MTPSSSPFGGSCDLLLPQLYTPTGKYEYIIFPHHTHSAVPCACDPDPSPSHVRWAGYACGMNASKWPRSASKFPPHPNLILSVAPGLKICKAALAMKRVKVKVSLMFLVRMPFRTTSNRYSTFKPGKRGKTKKRENLQNGCNQPYLVQPKPRLRRLAGSSHPRDHPR